MTGAARPAAASASIVIVGNEILSAKTEDENARFLVRELRELGVPLRRILVVADDVDEIAWAVRSARASSPYVFTSGGIGPTHDDVTIEGVARALSRKVTRHPALAALITGYLAGKDGHEVESALKMAELPEGTELLYGPGLTFPVAVVDGVYIFPGIPSILKKKWAAVRERFREAPYHLTEIYLSPEEHVIARRLYELQERFPELQLGSYPDIDSREFRVKVTLESKDPRLLEEAVAHLCSLLTPAEIVRVERAAPPP